MRKAFYFLILLLIVSSTANAQKAPIKYGNVPVEDLKMSVYPADTAAVAVVLCDYGYLDPGNFTFIRVLRIKILKEEGKIWGNIQFPPRKNAFVKGITFNYVNGKTEESELRSTSIFGEVVNGRNDRVSIEMPDVRPGSVIDVKYDYHGIPADWAFQWEIPVRHSELVMPYNPYVLFRYDISGLEPLIQAEEGHWTGVNMPPFRKEPYMSDPKNYITRIVFDILETKFSGMSYEASAPTPESIYRILQNDNFFGIPLRADGYMNNTAKEIERKGGTDIEKAKNALDQIKRYPWNGINSLYTSNVSLRNVHGQGPANSADINLALVQLLTKLNLDAFPVIISTRDNGTVYPEHPGLTRFNSVIAGVKIDSITYLLDATERFAPFDILPERDLNQYGWKYDINGRKCDPFNITPKKKKKETAIYNLTLDENLKLSGTVSLRKNDYAALDFRNKYDASHKDALLYKDSTMIIKNISIGNPDSINEPVKIHYEAELARSLENKDSILVNPMIFCRKRINPFTEEKRRYPVDFVLQTEEITSITIKIPEKLQILAVPGDEKIALPGNSASFQYQATVIGSTIQINCRLAINKIVFDLNEYQDLRAFYDKVIAKQAEMIVLKKQTF